MKHIFILFLLMIAAAPAWSAEADSFRFYKPIERAETEKESMVAAVLDGDVFAASRDGLPDLRVLDAEGKQTPMLVEKVVETISSSQRSEVRSRVVSLKHDNDRLRIVIELLNDESGAEGLTVFTPLKNYERRVRVFGSDDDFHWLPLEEHGLIFDYSRFMDVENREVRLTKNNNRRYAVEIVDIDDVRESLFREMTRKYRGSEEVEREEKSVFERRPFRIERIAFWKIRHTTRDKRDKKTDYYAAVSKLKDDIIERITIIDVSSRRQPITELTLETSSRNFQRPVRVQVPVVRGGHSEWRDIARGEVSLIKFASFERQSLTISFPEQRSEAYRIVVENGDNRSLDVTGVKARGNVYQAVFLAEPKVSYRLAYGSATAERGEYDAAAVLAPLRAAGHQPVEARLGPEVEIAVFDSAKTALKDIFGNPLVYGSAIAFLVILLAWALYAATRRIDRLPR